jgi:DNA repair protein RecN (Recombination protein N)
MIQELRIENFAIIEKLELDFSGRLIVFTGETGAGKSIIIDAVETLLGARSDPTMVRSGAERAYVEATFSIPANQQAEILALLKSEDLLEDEQTISLGREIRQNGRSTARVNGRTVHLALLRQLGEYLVDVHGQSEHLSLLRVHQHLGLLDSFAGTEPLLSAYTQTYRRFQTVRKDLIELRQAESEAARRIDMLNFQINEIESARLKPGEEEQLKEERNRLANAEGLASAAQTALQAIEEGTPDALAASDLLGQAAREVANLAKLDPSQAVLDEQAQSILENLAELSRSLRDYLEGVEFNPRRLDQVEERLELIHNLKRKYCKPGASSIEEVLTFSQDARRQLEEITHVSERISELEKEEDTLLVKIGEQGLALSQARHAASRQLEQQLELELEHLSMSGAHFKVSFVTRPDPLGAPLPDGSQLAFDATGLEQIEFLVAPNPGEGLKPLVKIASGGETSRLMLGIKNVLARADQVPTLIFDEIDQGIGGRVGTVVGNKLWILGRSHQVLCVTHLPQLAAFGDQHLHVSKSVQDGRTATHVQPLNGDDRLQELAQMMGEISEGTLHSARDLMATVRRTKEQTR